MRILRPVALYPRVQGICRCHAIGVPTGYRRPVVESRSGQFLTRPRVRPSATLATANAVHWLSAIRTEAVFGDIHRLLDDGGTLFFAEPGSPEVPFAPGFEEWKTRQPSRYEQGNWKAFWERANSLVGYDHTDLMGSREGSRIGDGMTVRGWIDLVETSDFQTVDVLWRDADVVIVAAQKA